MSQEQQEVVAGVRSRGTLPFRPRTTVDETRAFTSPQASPLSRSNSTLPAQLRLHDLDRIERKARLLRSTSDLLLLSHDSGVDPATRDKIKLALDVLGEVTL